MKKFASATLAIAFAVSFGGFALADSGGLPNESAYPDGTKDKGRKAVCVPPGSVFKVTAKDEGSNSDPFGYGTTPGQEVVIECGLGQPS